MPNLPEILTAICAFLVAYYFKELSNSIKLAVDSVKELNAKVGVIIERTETHSNEIEILREKTDTITSDVAHIKAHIGRNNGPI